MMTGLEEALRTSASHHRHLCPRQVLGVRMGLLAGDLLELALPRPDRRLLVFVETDGCFADGVSAATGCTVGHRTLRVEDAGKVAAVFVDVRTERAVRIAPHPEARRRARDFAPEATTTWAAYLLGYQRMPVEALLVWRAVRLLQPVAAIVSRPGRRVVCDVCQEEVINEREVVVGGRVLCRTCAGVRYYGYQDSTSVELELALASARPARTAWGGRSVPIGPEPTAGRVHSG